MDEEKIKEAVEYMVSYGTAHTSYGNWKFGADDLADAIGTSVERILEQYDRIFNLLLCRKEVLDVEEDSDNGVKLYSIYFGTDFCPNLWPY